MTASAWAYASRLPVDSPVDFGSDGYGLPSLAIQLATSPFSRAGRRLLAGNFRIAVRSFVLAPSSGARPNRTRVARSPIAGSAPARSLNRSSMRTCDSKSLRRGPSRPLRLRSEAILRRNWLIEMITSMRGGSCTSKFSSVSFSTLQKDHRLVEALLFAGDPPEFHQGPCIRLVDILVVWAKSSPFQ